MKVELGKDTIGIFIGQIDGSKTPNGIAFTKADKHQIPYKGQEIQLTNEEIQSQLVGIISFATKESIQALIGQLVVLEKHF